MADSKIPSIEPAPVPVTEQQLQPHTNHIMEEQPHVMAENVTLEVKAEQHTVGMTAIGIEKRSDEQHERIAVKGMKTVMQKQQIEVVKKTETSEGQIMECWVQKRYLLMVDVAIMEIEHTKYPQMIEGATPVYSPSPFEKCLNCCCTAYSCKWLLSPLKKRQHGVQEEQKEEKDLIPKTESIRRAQTLGIKNIVVSIHNIFTSTPFGSTVREVAVYGGFLWALLFFLISLSGFIRNRINENDVDDDFFGLFKTIFGAIGMVFSIFDLFTIFTIVVLKHAKNGNSGKRKRIKGLIIKLNQILMTAARTNVNVVQSLVPLHLMSLVCLLMRCCIIQALLLAFFSLQQSLLSMIMTLI